MDNHTSSTKMETERNINASASVSASASAPTETEIDVDNYIEEPHIIIDSCFRGKHLMRLVEHQIESYNDFIQCKGRVAARSSGKARDEGKEYVVQDGDVIEFKFNV